MPCNACMNCKRFYTAKEAAEVLGIHPEKVRRNVRVGNIPSIKAFRKVLIPSGFFSCFGTTSCHRAERREDEE